MAHTHSAMKRMRQNEKRRTRNRRIRSRARTFVSKASALIAEGDRAEAETAVLAALRELDKTAQKGIIRHNNADRRKSRLMKKLDALAKS
ncbi:MAG: 30S ribosomal protein S20 [Chloroflexi bacterium RBG_13_56_8]|nr:MAG: 30S ribosomal protein S20 [Chloroflexi bacterium RBG_13_56_8]